MICRTSLEGFILLDFENELTQTQSEIKSVQAQRTILLHHSFSC